MAWWDDLWLNEGFASWFETKATDHFHPEWSMLVGLVNKRESAMAADSLASSHAIVSHIRTASEADSAFDAISYSKGEAVVAMLEAYAGEAKWRDGVRRYLAAHAYGNAVTADLWRAQEETEIEVKELDRIVAESKAAPMGPFFLTDLLGLDTVLHVAEHLKDSYGDRFHVHKQMQELVAAGDLGAKTGRGFYEHGS